jgi:hypothetical protein
MARRTRAPHIQGKTLKDQAGPPQSLLDKALAPVSAEITKLLPSQLTARNIARIYTGKIHLIDDLGVGGAASRLSRKSLFSMIGYHEGDNPQSIEYERFTGAVDELIAAKGLKETIESGVGILEPGDPDILRDFADRDPLSGLDRDQAALTARVKNVDAALARHADQLPPSLRPATPTSGAK